MYKVGISMFYEDKSSCIDIIDKEETEIIVEEIVKNFLYKEFVTGYKIKSIYSCPLSIKECAHNMICVDDKDKYIANEVYNNNVCMLMFLNSKNSTFCLHRKYNKFEEVSNIDELYNYIEEFSQSSFYKKYKILANQKIKIKK